MQKLIHNSLIIFLIFVILSNSNNILGQTKKKSKKVYLPEPPPIGDTYIPKVLESFTKVDTLNFQKSDFHKLVDKTPIYFIPPKKFTLGTYPIYRFGGAWIEFKFENRDFINEVSYTEYLKIPKSLRDINYSINTQRLLNKEKDENGISYTLFFGNRRYFVKVRAYLPKSLMYLDAEIKSSILSVGVDETAFTKDFENENLNLNYKKDNYFIRSYVDSRSRLHQFKHYKDPYKDFTISKGFVKGTFNQFVEVQIGKEGSEEYIKNKIKILNRSENKIEFIYYSNNFWFYQKMTINENGERIIALCFFPNENDLNYFQKLFENIF